MTAVAERVQCLHCTYAADNAVSLIAHVTIVHPEAAAEAAPATPKRRSSRNVDPVERATSGPAPAAGGTAVADLPLDLLDVGHNVRVNVAELEELAASIREVGVLQPIKATGPHADGRYLVTWGQRRTLASRMAERTTVPAIVLPPTADVDADGATRSIEQLVENLHRADLNPIDRAQAMRAVVDSGVSQAELARKLGIAPSTVANDLRLLEAAPAIRKLLEAGEITPAHVKAVLGLDEDEQLRLAKRTTDHHLSAHDLEREAKYSRDNAQQRQKDKALAEARAAEAIALLEKVGNRKATIVSVTQYGYSGDAVRAALAADGWTIKTEYLDVVKEPGSCGCKGVWRLEIPYDAKEAVRLNPACNDESHRGARKAEQDASWERQLAESAAKRAAEEAAATARAAAMGPWLTSHLGTPLGQRALLYALVTENGSDDSLVDRYWDGEREALYDLADATWVLIEKAAEADLPELIAAAVADVLTGWNAGEGVLGALDAAIAAEAASRSDAAKPAGSEA